MIRLIYHPDAEAELIEAAHFYEQRVPTLGAEFLDAVDQAVRTITDAPERWRIIEADIRHYIMPRFP
jgi:toxin ParE1/3/4